MPDITTILLDKNGIFAGLRNNPAENEQVDLERRRTLCIVLRAPGDGRKVSYGRSQLENVRHLWGRWKAGLETENIDQGLYQGYFGGPDTNAAIEQVAVDVLDAYEIALNQLLEGILNWQIGRTAIGQVRLALKLKPVPATILEGENSAETPSPSNKGFATHQELATENGLNSEATRKALNRWRQANAGGDGFIENHDRRPNEPQFLYDRTLVAPVLNRLRTLATRREILRTKSSGERPAKILHSRK